MKTSPHFEDLINKIRKGEVIFWIGSGFSKTSGFLLGSELVDRIKENVNESDIQFIQNKNSLDEVSEEFIQLYSRKKLEDLLIAEFGKKPQSLHFQELIQKIPQVTKIITTNYDTCFEQTYGDKICKILIDTDIVKCSKINKVNIYKIHGDIDCPEKIIISKTDYAMIYKKDSENLVWNEIRSLITKSSILFIGYSFEDLNVKLIFDDILERLGETHNEFFLISPSVPSHRQTYLKEKYSIKYIDMTVEKAIPKISRVIEKNLLHDIKNGHIKPPFLNQALQERNIDAGFSFNPDGTLNIKTIEGSSGVECHLSYTVAKENFKDIEKLHELLEEKDFGEITLSSTKGSLAWSTNIGDSELFNTDSLKDVKELEIKIKSQPKKKIKADLGIKDSDIGVECVSGEHYFSKYGFKIDLHYLGFSIIITGNNQKFKDISFKIKPTTVIQAYRIFSLLHEWVNGKPLQLFFENAKNPLEITPANVNLPKYFFDAVWWNYNGISGLMAIQQKFSVNFNDFKELTKEDYENVITLKKLLDGNRVKIDPFTCTVKPLNHSYLLKSLDDAPGVGSISIDKMPYKILGREIILDNCSVEIANMIFLNKDEIRSHLERGKETFEMKIGSQTNEIFLVYNSNKKPIS